MTPLTPCGTYAAYQRHVKRRENPCQDCVEASRKYLSEWRANRKLSDALDQFAATVQNKTPLRPDPKLYALLAQDRVQHPYKPGRKAAAK